MAVILIRGTGDVGSAIAYPLFKAGHAVVLHDQPKPSHPRRGMAFGDALFAGRGELDGVRAKYAKAFRDLKKMIRCGVRFRL